MAFYSISNIQAIISFPGSRMKKEIKQFPSKMSYFRRHLRNFSTIAKLLHRLERQIWMELFAGKFFCCATWCTCEPSILAHYDPSKPVELHTVASGASLGVMVTQQYSDERVIAHDIRSSLKTEENYFTTERDCVVIY